MKKFKDTKVGAWLKQNVPNVLETVGDLLPSNGVFGIAKNLISKANLTPEQRAEFDRMENEFLLDVLQIEAEDRASARTREVDFIKAAGHADYIVWLLVGAGLGIMSFLLWHLVKENIPTENKDIVIHAVGIVEGVIISIYSYYFGSSQGSRIKDMRPKS